MNKKGLSPLASTIILLVVSILIGIVVMSWGKGYVEQATAKASVQEVAATQASIYQDLDERLMKGEINQEQYNKIKQVLISQNSK